MKFEQKWMGRNCTKQENEWFPVSVPGNIQYDYGVFHGFPDVQYSDNCRYYEPIEDDHWEYSTVLSYEKQAGERVFFVSGGIDYRYDVLLNGKKLYAYEGMFRGFELDLTDGLTGKEDVLTVHIYPHPKSTTGRKGTRDEADASCKPPVSYGWDWNPRLLNSGLWEEAYIETRGASYIGDFEVLASLSDDLKTGTVTYAFACSVACETALYDMEGNEVYRGTERTVTVKNPELWWCNGQGTPYLYRWVIRNSAEERSGYIGFRTMRLVRNQGASGPAEFPKGRYEAPITIELNGRRIFAKGSNWVNPSLFWGQITTEYYDELITLARNANMNIFRMWGGAGRAKRSFYELCDRYGIMLWQEFMLACNNYVGTPEYMAVLESEASAIIKDLRCHPSLVFWCGGNELFNSWSGMDEQSHPLRLLNKLCFELDYQRPFLYTSPIFGMAHGGYTFYDEAQGGEVFRQFQRARNTAYTEFGVPSISAVEELERIIPKEELKIPIERTSAWITHHGFDAWGKERWLCQDVLSLYFGAPETVADLVRQSNWLQCEGYRGAFEEMRRQWPHCSMGINWCFNEPWITVGDNNLLTYPAKPKPAYEYVKLAMRPTLFSAKIEKFYWRAGETFEAELWLLNDAPVAAEGTVHASVTVGDETFDLLDWKASTNANGHKQGPTVRCILPEVEGIDRFTLTLQAADGRESAYTFMYGKKKKKISKREMNRG